MTEVFCPFDSTKCHENVENGLATEWWIREHQQNMRQKISTKHKFPTRQGLRKPCWLFSFKAPDPIISRNTTHDVDSAPGDVRGQTFGGQTWQLKSFEWWHVGTQPLTHFLFDFALKDWEFPMVGERKHQPRHPVTTNWKLCTVYAA